MTISGTAPTAVETVGRPASPASSAPQRHHVSGPPEPQRFVRLHCDGRGEYERGATEATVKDGHGTPRPEWNAVVNPIEAFSSEPPGRHASPFTVLAAAPAPAP